MSNDFATAAWVDSRHHFHGDLRRALRHLMFVFRRLNARQYDAPWGGRLA